MHLLSFRHPWRSLFVPFLSLLAVAVGIAAYSADGVADNPPTDNPVTARYGADAYPWTNDIRWANVKNIKDFPGATWDVRFAAARDAAAAEGGGVVYFPAGVYEFRDGIALKNGVVIRGATPACSDAKLSEYNPPSKLVFPKYVPSLTGNGTPTDAAFKMIVTGDAAHDSNIGLVNVDVNRARIALQGEFGADGNEIGSGRNRLVYGVRIFNAIGVDRNVPNASQQPWQRWTDRFSAAIKVVTGENALVANCRVPQAGVDADTTDDSFAMPGYLLQDYSGAYKPYTLKFDYNNRHGIAVNRFCPLKKPGTTPDLDPWMFRKGIAVRDNYVFHYGRCGINVGGDGALVLNNVTRMPASRREDMLYTVAGTTMARGNATNEFRGIDISGYNYVVEGNDIKVYDARTPDGHYSTDGEAILHQMHGSSGVRNAVIRNNRVNSYIGLYKMETIEGATITGNVLDYEWRIPQTGRTMIYVNADTNAAKFACKNVHIDGNTLLNGCDILFSGTVEGSGNTVVGNNAPDGGTVKYSAGVKPRIEDNPGITAVAQ